MSNEQTVPPGVLEAINAMEQVAVECGHARRTEQDFRRLTEARQAVFEAARNALATQQAPALTDEQIDAIVEGAWHTAETETANGEAPETEWLRYGQHIARALLAAASPNLPPLTDSMRAVLRNEKGTYQSEDDLYAALVAASPTPTEDALDASYADFQQKRGMAMDIIDEALQAYHSWMLDDDYDATTALRTIMDRMSERRKATQTKEAP